MLQSLIVYRISPLPFVCLFVYFCITLLITDKQLEGYWVPWETLAWDIHPRINQISWAVLGLSGAVKQNGPRDLTERKFSVLVLCFLCPRLASFLLNGPTANGHILEKREVWPHAHISLISPGENIRDCAWTGGSRSISVPWRWGEAPTRPSTQLHTARASPVGSISVSAWLSARSGIT